MPKTEEQKLKSKLHRKEKAKAMKSALSSEIKKEFNRNLRIAKKNPKSFAGMSAPMANIRGKGNFFTGVKDFFTKAGDDGTSRTNKIFNGIGRAAGDMVGLGSLGGKAGSFLSSVLGLGDYSTGPAGSLESAAYIRRPPAFGTINQGSDIVINHQEYIGDVNSSTGFLLNSYVNNPGNPVAFPWLSQIAQYFELFEWQGLVYSYKTTSSVATGTTTGAMGTVVIATEYDCVDTPYTNKKEMENAEFASNAAPYQTFLHPVECDKQRIAAMNMSYVLPGITTVAQANIVDGYTTDPRLYVPSITSVASVANAASGQAIGELWVTYSIRLSKPVLENTTTVTNFSQHVRVNVEPSTQIVTSNVTVGGPAFTIQNSSSQFIITNPNNLTGYYLMAISVIYSSQTPTVPGTAMTTTNASSPLIFLGGLPASSFSASGNTYTAFALLNLQNSATIAFIYNVPSSGANLECLIVPCNNSLTFDTRKLKVAEQLEILMDKVRNLEAAGRSSKDEVIVIDQSPLGAGCK